MGIGDRSAQRIDRAARNGNPRVVRKKTEGTGTPAQSGGITRKRATHSFSTRDNDTADKHAVGAQRINRQCNTRIHHHRRATMQMARADHGGQAA